MVRSVSVLLFQVSSLKSGQIEFESMKYEVKRLIEDTELMQSQTEEANKLKGIAERQVEEALLSLQQEREQRLALKLELDQLRNAEQMMQLNNLANSMGLGLSVNSGTDEDGTDSPGALKHLESSFKFGGKGGDLFSEVHGNLEEELGTLKKEKRELEKNLGELCSDYDEALSNLNAEDAELNRLLSFLRNNTQSDNGTATAEVKRRLASSLDEILKLSKELQEGTGLEESMKLSRVLASKEEEIGYVKRKYSRSELCLRLLPVR